MKKSIIISVIMFLIMGIFMASVNAASATVRVGASNSNPDIGNSIIITISFSQPVGTASLNLNYNNSVVQYTGSNAWKATDRGGSVKLDYIDASFENKTITSMTVTFKTIAEGTGNFSVSNVVISNANGDELSANISSNATINVKKQEEPPVNPPINPSTPDTNQKPNSSTSSNTNKNPNTNKKPSTNTNKDSNTNTNTNTNTSSIVDTNTNEQNIIDNSISNTISDKENNNQTYDEPQTEQNEEVKNEENKPNYMVYVIIAIIAIAIIIVIIIIIYRVRNYE